MKLENGYEDFLKTLKREPIQPNKNMLMGQHFENVLNATLNGAELPTTHEWYKPITEELYHTLYGAQQQVRLSRDINICGINFVLYGVFDFLKAGVIYDTKYSKTYDVGKYLDSPQHPTYFALCPEAYEFQYKICDGTYIYTETYRPDETEPVETTIKHFLNFLDKQNLFEIYCDGWRSKYD